MEYGMTVCVIAALDRADGIGLDGKMPWPKIQEDLRRFRALTVGNAVIMGRVTYESIGRALPGRTNYVVSRTKTSRHAPLLRDDARGVTWARYDEDALEDAACARNHDRVWFIGGAGVYESALKYTSVDELYITRIDSAYDCDRVFPSHLVHAFDWVSDESDAAWRPASTTPEGVQVPAYRFLKYTRRG